MQPKWCELICKFLGWDNRRKLYKKRLDLRKSKPNLKIPFKCYIYCTQGDALAAPCLNNSSYAIHRTGNGTLKGKRMTADEREKSDYSYANGKVIGEFVCDYILTHCEMSNADVAEQMSCVSREDILKYANGKEVFGWHISDLIIYDKPKELSEFYVCDNEAVKQCEHRERIYTNPDFTNGVALPGSYLCKDKSDWCVKCKEKPITRAPQSWCYVEKLRGDG